MPDLNTPTIDLVTAAEVLGISKSSAYAAARDGKFPTPTIRIGGRIVVPTAPLRALLGLDDRPAVTE